MFYFGAYMCTYWVGVGDSSHLTDFFSLFEIQIEVKIEVLFQGVVFPFVAPTWLFYFHFRWQVFFIRLIVVKTNFIVTYSWSLPSVKFVHVFENSNLAIVSSKHLSWVKYINDALIAFWHALGSFLVVSHLPKCSERYSNFYLTFPPCSLFHYGLLVFRVLYDKLKFILLLGLVMQKHWPLMIHWPRPASWLPRVVNKTRRYNFLPE